MINRFDIQNRETAAGREALSPSELAADWGVDVRTVRRDIRKGALPAYRLPNGRFRIRRRDADQYGRPLE